MEGPLSVPALTSTQYNENAVAVPMSAPGGEDGEIAENNSPDLIVDFDVISLVAVVLVCAASVTVCAFRWPESDESSIEKVRLNNTNTILDMMSWPRIRCRTKSQDTTTLSETGCNSMKHANEEL
jgi:hypothetical protein